MQIFTAQQALEMKRHANLLEIERMKTEREEKLRKFQMQQQQQQMSLMMGGGMGSNALMEVNMIQTLMQQHEQLQQRLQQSQKSLQPMPSPATTFPSTSQHAFQSMVSPSLPFSSSAGNYTVNETKSRTIVHFFI